LRLEVVRADEERVVLARTDRGEALEQRLPRVVERRVSDEDVGRTDEFHVGGAVDERVANHVFVRRELLWTLGVAPDALAVVFVERRDEGLHGEVAVLAIVRGVLDLLERN